MKQVMMITAIWGLMITSVQASGFSPVETENHESSFVGRNEVDVYGDDVFPWPWGTECPFPWTEIQGTYKVRGVGGRGPYSGHYVSFETIKSSMQKVELLTIKQYDRRGLLYSKGQVYSSREQRIVRGILRNVNTSDEYMVIVRSYVKDRMSSCSGATLVTAVTFCPLRGRRCMDDASYTLERMK